MSRRSAASRRRRDAVFHLLFKAVAPAFALLSWATCQRLGPRLGDLGWRVSRRDRERTLAHLELALPELAPDERLALARASFRHHGTTLAECLHLLRRDPATVRRVTTVLGWEHVEAARKTGRPLVILTGHCGNWELLAALINARGLGMAVVARQLDDAVMDRLLVGFRARFGTETIARGSMHAARRLLTVLRSGGALGMLIDQDTKVEGVWVPFFGRPAYTPVGAAQIALRQKALVLPVFIERLTPGEPCPVAVRELPAGAPAPPGQHLVRFLPPLDLPPTPTGATATMTAAIEEQVRRRPSQWVWMHRRWRRQPPVENAVGPADPTNEAPTESGTATDPAS
jgi:KDO2-lipid IV(A) lauroyltransferase